MAVPPPARPRPRPGDPSPAKRKLGNAMNIEDQVRYAYFSPSPQSYDPGQPERFTSKPLGKISNSQVPSALDAPAKLKEHVPGPGYYETPDTRDFALPDGGRLNRAAPVQRLKLDMDSGPPPGNYGIPNDPTVPRAVFGKFGRDPKYTKFIRDEQLRSRHVPGPHYDVMDAMQSTKPFCPEGGRTLQASKPESYFDRVTRIAESKPGPDSYNLPGAIEPHKSIGKCVWRYQSESLKDSKRAIQLAMGAAHEVPGPGAYDIPDPMPIAGVPTLKGRSLGHAMPAPFAYNCAPDLSRKYESLAPVRQQNSGDQIYGRDLKKGASLVKAGKRASSAALADKVDPSYMPVSLMTEQEQPAVAVQWRSGGFTDLRKSKSAGAITNQEHNMVKEARKYYPTLAKKHRTSSTFLPLACRRSESVKTHRKADELQHLHRKKWEIQALTDELAATAAETIEPLDEDKLRQQALDGLVQKAKARMRLEGVSSDQQELFLSEFPRVVNESTNSAVASPFSSYPGTVRENIDDSAVAETGEPGAEPPPRGSLEADLAEDLYGNLATFSEGAEAESSDAAAFDPVREREPP